jgi:hypothetical protein
MKFQTKEEAFNYIKELQKQQKTPNQEELQAFKEFFTEEELADMCFTKISIEECFSHFH